MENIEIDERSIKLSKIFTKVFSRVLCYEFLDGVPPFESKANNKTFKNCPVDVGYPASISADAEDLSPNCFKKSSK